MADGRVIEEVADQIEEVAEVTRRLTGREVGFFFGGIGIGAAIGFGIGYITQENKMATKYEKIAEGEIAEMREHFRQKMVALQAREEGKRPLAEIVEEAGYVSTDAEEPESEEETPGEDPVEKVKRNIFQERMELDQSWDYAVEAKRRAQNPGVPYVIHVEEHRENTPEHEQVTFTFYEEDGVLCDVRDQIVDDPEGVVGLGNLQRFGEGSLDPSIVYVRNDRLTLDIEICLNPKSYAEDVHGLRHSDERRRPTTRRHFDDE